MNQTIDLEKLKDSFLGEELDQGDLDSLEGVLSVQQLSAGDVLVNEGDEDRRLFLLTEGRIEVLSRKGEDYERVHTMKAGEFAGTRAFIDAMPRQATLKAKEDATVYSLTPEDFESLIDTRPWLVYKIMRALFRITHVNLMRMNTEARELANYVFKRGGRY